MRTLPKKAGNISLSLREWGLFCIESRLQGAGGVCYTYGMEESNTHYNKERRLTPMKKLARLTALLLTGALLLVLTACGTATGAETEQQAKQRLLMEITSYRTSLELGPLVEVEQLSKAEQVRIAPFRAANTTVLPDSERIEASQIWTGMTAGWTFCDGYGLDGTTVDGEPAGILSAKVLPNTTLQAALRSSGAFDTEDGTSIGIAVVTIKGQMYWTCSIFYK